MATSDPQQNSTTIGDATEPTEDLSHEQRYADGLVLTEWKTASSQNKVASKFREAREQAAKYVRGALGGNELRAYRYAVGVTWDRAIAPEDHLDDEITYRHINIAVKPATPSRGRVGRTAAG
jgi:hypothetical protein